MAMGAPGRHTKDEEAARRLKLVERAMRGDDVLANVTSHGYVAGSQGITTVLNDREAERLMREGMKMRFLIELAPIASKVLKSILNNEELSAAVRLKAAQTAFGLAGFVAPRAAEPPGSPDETISKQTPAQLRAFIAQAQNELANRSTPVLEGKAVTPEVAPELPAEAAGMLD